ncbi:gastrula zinc finger protein XlCGF57.1-like [Aricia agestis]|uniref:gastrula zinc finger protein XlCGF57.1-like n=1 Tax=Aricia agestis TaxID=91739 RepID=UPI001C20C196|nr:gastrula zinc finger protein XlCGF57.1-like [Aricia agestis]
MGEEVKHSWLCRVCLEPTRIGNRSIHEKYKEYCIMEYINKLTNVNMKSTDGLPDKICSNCFLELEVALNFIEKCEKTDIFLKNSHKKLTQSNKTIKVEYDVPEVKSEANEEDEVYEVDYLDEFQHLDVDQQENEVEQTKQITPTSEVQCHDCGNFFKSKCKLRVHWKQTHMLDSLICDFCKRKFKSYRALHRHLKNKSQSCFTARDPNVRVEGEGKLRTFYCKECGYKSPRVKDLAAHLRTHSGEKPFQCNLCHKAYSQQSSLQGHMEGAHRKYLVEITCQYCGKHIKGRNRVYRHLRDHHDKPRPCPICEKPVTGKYMRKHMLRHTGVKTYTCETCAAAFYTSAELANHRRYAHIKSVMYSCSLCEYKNIRKAIIAKHESKHNDQNFPCVVCGIFFPTAETAMVHKARLHDNENSNECPQCHRTFIRKESIRKHMLKKHSSVIDHKPIVKCESIQNKIEPIIIETPKASPI